MGFVGAWVRGCVGAWVRGFVGFSGGGPRGGWRRSRRPRRSSRPRRGPSRPTMATMTGTSGDGRRSLPHHDRDRRLSSALENTTRTPAPARRRGRPSTSAPSNTTTMSQRSRRWRPESAAHQPVALLGRRWRRASPSIETLYPSTTSTTRPRAEHRVERIEAVGVHARADTVARAVAASPGAGTRRAAGRGASADFRRMRGLGHSAAACTTPSSSVAKSLAAAAAAASRSTSPPRRAPGRRGAPTPRGPRAPPELTQPPLGFARAVRPRARRRDSAISTATRALRDRGLGLVGPLLRDASASRSTFDSRSRRVRALLAQLLLEPAHVGARRRHAPPRRGVAPRRRFASRISRARASSSRSLLGASTLLGRGAHDAEPELPPVRARGEQR